MLEYSSLDLFIDLFSIFIFVRIHSFRKVSKENFASLRIDPSKGLKVSTANQKM